MSVELILEVCIRDPFANQHSLKRLSEGLQRSLASSPSLWEVRVSSYTSIKMIYHSRLNEEKDQMVSMKPDIKEI